MPYPHLTPPTLPFGNPGEWQKSIPQGDTLPTPDGVAHAFRWWFDDPNRCGSYAGVVCGVVETDLGWRLIAGSRSGDNALATLPSFETPEEAKLYYDMVTTPPEANAFVQAAPRADNTFSGAFGMHIPSHGDSVFKNVSLRNVSCKNWTIK